ncbi:MAG: radical SAM protein [Elusimicrobiota bacterium]
MPLVRPVIRPPSEAGSFLLQVTVGCSSNSCSFCGAYNDRKFALKDKKEIFGDIEEERKYNPERRRVFLLDGDALAVQNSRLIPVMKRLQEAFPKLRQISSYANAGNISSRTDRELMQLRKNKLRRIYIGLESGSTAVLEKCKKPSSAEEMIKAVRRCEEIGIKCSIMVLLGLGGEEDSARHVRETIKALNKMQPSFLSFLSVMLIPGTLLHKKAIEGKFKPLNSTWLMQEARDILKGLHLKKTIFRSNHASNHLPLEGRLPGDKKTLVSKLNSAIEGKSKIKPEYLRGL